MNEVKKQAYLYIQNSSNSDIQGLVRGFPLRPQAHHRWASQLC